MNQRAQLLYQKTQVATATPWELTTLLYNGSLKFMRLAIEGMEQQNFEKKNENIKKAISIIDELDFTLDRQYDIALQLSSLYQFMKRRLLEANIELKPSYVQEVIGLMLELRDTWVTAMKQLHSKSSVGER